MLTFHSVFCVRGSSSDMYDLSWSNDASLIAVGCIDHSVRIWHVADSKLPFFCINKCGTLHEG
jgi:WD40 repeat protein